MELGRTGNYFGELGSKLIVLVSPANNISLKITHKRCLIIKKKYLASVGLLPSSTPPYMHTWIDIGEKYGE